GKTTLLRAVIGTIAFSGEIVIDGHEAGSMSASERSRRIAVVPQRPITPPEMTGFDYVLLGRTPHVSYFGVEGRGDLQVVVDVLERLSLGE
ncbi:ABC transporter, partial [Enterococcus hirae]